MLIFALMQDAFFTSFLVRGAKADLLIIFVTMLGLYNGIEEGMIFGGLAGLITAALSSAPAGLLTGAYCFAGFCAGVIKEKIYPDHFVVPLAAALVMSILSVLLLFGGGLMSGILKSTGQITEKILPFLVLNVIFAIPMGYLVRSRWITSRRPLE